MTAKARRRTGEDTAGAAKTFVGGNARVERMLAKPGMAEAVAGVQDRMRQADRAHAMWLAALRNAFELTQTELARELGVSQASVAKIERRSDMLLSTMTGYVAALGGRIRHVVAFDDAEIEIELHNPEAPDDRTKKDMHTTGGIARVPMTAGVRRVGAD